MNQVCSFDFLEELDTPQNGFWAPSVYLKRKLKKDFTK